MKDQIRKTLSVSCAIYLALLLSTPARADEPDPARAATAQSLYESANADMDSKNYVEARKKLEEVVKLLPDALGAQLTLAECYENLGKLASAWAQYSMVAALAPKQGQPERAQRAADRAADLRPRLATLTITVPPDVARIPGISITRDRIPVGEAQWGTPVPVDTGGHEIAVTAPGRATWTKQVEVLANGTTVTMKVSAPPPKAGGEAPIAQPQATWLKPLGLTAVAAGGAGLALGAVTLGLAFSKFSESNTGHCDAQDFCDERGVDLRRETRTLGNVATGGFIAGAALATAGVVLVIVAPPSSGSKGNERVGARLQVLPGGVAFAGRF